jgi:SAM-dependent methyltransferase
MRADKAARRKCFDELAPTRDAGKARHPIYHQEVERLCRFLIPPGASVLEIGCGTGDLLHALQPVRGLGVDLSPRMVEIARRKYPDMEFAVGDVEALDIEEQFDYVLLSDLVGHLDDVWLAFRNLHRVCHPASRLVVTYYNYLWEPILQAAERLGLKTPQALQNWLPPQDLTNLALITGFEPVQQGYWLLCPVRVPLLTPLANRILAHLPGLRRLNLVHYLVARPEPARRETPPPTCTIVVPCRNEVGNITQTVARIPTMGSHTEIIFVDGDSTDGTRETIEEAMRRWAGVRDIRLIRQVPATGKGEAVRLGFAAAKGDVVVILDADLSVRPEDLMKFFLTLAEGRGEFVNGCRMVYPMERQAMRFFNILANKIFGMLFSWLLEQRIRDTLCGTKALLRRDYERIAASRAVFGVRDPFGDFDLLFGAAKLTLKIVEMPVRYHERTYGNTKIRRFYHGWLLLKMFLLAVRKLKFR